MEKTIVLIIVGFLALLFARATYIVKRNAEEQRAYEEAVRMDAERDALHRKVAEARARNAGLVDWDTRRYSSSEQKGPVQRKGWSDYDVDTSHSSSSNSDCSSSSSCGD